MSEEVTHRTLLEELDARQDDVLAQLDQLNARLESLLKTALATRESAFPAAA